MEATAVFEYLVGLEQRSRVRAAPLPRQEELKDTWTGMGFTIDNQNAVVPLEQIQEVLTIPTMTVVPGTQSWVKGIANVRGSLLPIMDLRGFLGLPPLPPTPTTRVLVVNHEGIFAGLIVDQVWGLKHFFLDQAIEGSTDALDNLTSEMKPYMVRAFADDERTWPVFSLHAIAEDSNFLQVAV